MRPRPLHTPGRPLRRSAAPAVVSTLLVAALAIATLLFGTPAAASITHAWSASFGDTRMDDYGTSVSTDASGNLFVTGAFEGSVDFGGGPLTSDGSLHWRDAFLAKFDAAGNHIWSRSFGGPRDDQGKAGLADPWGNVVLAGRFWGLHDFGGGPIGTDRNYAVVLAKYDDAGNYSWGRSFGTPDPLQPVFVDGASVDTTGTIYLAGHFKGTLDMGGDVLSSLNGAAFVACYDTGGAHLWSVQAGDRVPTAWDIAADGSGNAFVTHSDGSALVLTKYDAAGVELWQRRFIPTDDTRGGALAADADGNVYLTGMFAGTIEFGGTPLESGDPGSVFVAKFDPQGDQLWSRAYAGGSDQDAGRSVCTDRSGNVIVAGTMSGAIDFGHEPLTSAGGIDAFLVKFGVDGNPIWSRSFGGTGNDGAIDVHVGARGGVYLTGAFEDTASFGGDPLVSTGKADIFVTRHDIVTIRFFDAHAVADVIHLYSGLSEGLGIETVDIYRGDASGPLTLYRKVPYTDASFHYQDRQFTPGRTYQYRIGVVTAYGESFSPIRTVNTARYTTTLMPAAPNPFNPGTTIRYELEQAGPITLSIYDVRGRRVTTLIDDSRGAGPHSVRWDGTTITGTPAASGVYFCRLESSSGVVSQRMVLLK